MSYELLDNIKAMERILPPFPDGSSDDTRCVTSLPLDEISQRVVDGRFVVVGREAFRAIIRRLEGGAPDRPQSSPMPPSGGRGWGGG